jgi:transposase
MRLGFDGLAARVSQVLRADPFSGHLFLSRSKRADYLKLLHYAELYRFFGTTL